MTAVDVMGWKEGPRYLDVLRRYACEPLICATARIDFGYRGPASARARFASDAGSLIGEAWDEAAVCHLGSVRKDGFDRMGH